ncbi:MAG: DUF4093 domain-containing protein [Firmicutes bacterium]|nr:DUF4093 domain-containing protein [Bacillota bacterium]
MYKIKETVIVEGIYDKIRLSGFLDGLIFVTGGFSVFNNKKAQESIKTLAEKTGIVVLTDSDAAGFKIRSFVKQLVPEEQVKHAYIPEIHGKERRKRLPGKEGLLGVEGIDNNTILNALIKSGCEIDGSKTEKLSDITKADLVQLGLCGGENSSALRNKIAAAMGLPSKISANMLLAAINRMISPEELARMVANAENV